jgi:radical SAM superfamily enzyme YgiQ (UPF0313 family)
MRIKLIVPKWPGHSIWSELYFKFPFLSTAVLGALTPAGHTVRLEDENVKPIDFSDVPDLVGITVLTPLSKRAYELADEYRKRGAKVVLGGFHPTWMTDEALGHADAVVAGEAEYVWADVVRDAEAGKLKKIYKADERTDVQDIPAPDRDILRERGYFFTNVLQTTRGCPFDCKFCSVTAFYGGTYRVRPVEEIEREIDSFTGGAGFVLFVDDNIVGNRAYARRLFSMLKEKKIRWMSQASTNILKDPELLKLASESGCHALFMGFESLNQDNLDLMGKKMNAIEAYTEVISKLHDHGIGVHGSFIFGYDHDDESVFDRVLDFTVKAKLDAAFMPVLTPFPGTLIREQLLQEGRVLTDDWSLYDMEHVVFKPKLISPERLQAGHDYVNQEFYSASNILKRIGRLNRSLWIFGPMNWDLRRAWRRKKYLANTPGGS